MKRVMSYEEYVENFQEDIVIACAETGADRESDFNLDDVMERLYKLYIRNKHKPSVILID